ncbi:MAG: amino acid permease [Candidatus Pacebacteria bacterium]|nr:amino acid permease [Candidatus Paceibacterota bacterium]
MLNKNYIFAVSSMVGTSVGVGIFSLPYVASKSGFLPFVILIVILGVITTILGLMYGEITLRTTNKGRLVGYCEKYLGKKGKIIATIVVLFTLYSSLLVYIIIGGIFGSAVFSSSLGGNELTYSLIMFAVISVGIYISLKVVSVIEFLMVIFLFITILGIVLKGIPIVDVGNLVTHNSSQFFFPFGAILFSLGALSAIPVLEHIMKKKQKKIKDVIIIGNIIPIIIYILFVVVVLGITGAETSVEALYGLNVSIGNGIVTLGLIFGIFAISTSFLMLGINLKEMFWYDYHLSEKKAWALTCFVPLIVFVLGLRDFITVVNIAGGIAGGFIGILIIIIFYRAKKMGDIKPAYSIKVPVVISLVMVVIYSIGIAYQLIENFKI